MGKLVVLSLGTGDLMHGFPAVTVQIWEDHSLYLIKKLSGALAPEPEILELYKRWRLLYEALQHRLGWRPRIQIDRENITNVSESDFTEICQQLRSQINRWFDSDLFHRTDQQLRSLLSQNEEIRLVIETDNVLLRQLPWHQWNFFEQYSRAEFALSVQEFERLERSPKPSNHSVKILGILGNSEGINVQADRLLLDQLSGAAVTFLSEPTRKELNDQLWDKDWDILFFAGHSSDHANDAGRIYINQTESLTISQLRHALKAAIRRGLKLAIFNSCNGLGIAKELADLQIPQMIVMAEAVPDYVAQEFLKYFLIAFSQGCSFYLAVRAARERLQGLEDVYPCATWLPVICQNPAELPLSWQQLSGSASKAEQQSNSSEQTLSPTPTPLQRLKSPWRSLRKAVSIGAIATALILGARSQGWLQAVELPIYDQLMRLRPTEGQDDRLLLITIDDEDIVYQQDQGWQMQFSLADEALRLLLQKLMNEYQPIAIGLDIVRDHQLPPEQAELANLLQSDRIYAGCFVGNGGKPDLSPPPDIENIEQHGFINTERDTDGIVRRQYLTAGISPTSSCTTPYHLSTQLALHYFAEESIPVEFGVNQARFGQAVFRRLKAPALGYQKQELPGRQVLLNYRSNPAATASFDVVSLTDVLTDNVKPATVQNRIVLVGVTTSTTGDLFATPYSMGQRQYQEMPGVILNAQMTSYLIAAALGERKVISVLPVWGETVWVLTWCIAGGILVLAFRLCKQTLLAVGVAVIVLSGVGYGLFLQGYLVSLVPAAIGLLATSATSVVYSQSKSAPTISKKNEPN